MSSAITIEFEKWKANEAATGKAVILNEFVFAYIPNLDITKPVDRNEKLPPESLIKHRADVNKTGLVNENTVAYSVTLGTDVGDFEFNWIGLLNKESGTLAMITHAPTQRKIKTQGGQQGNVLMRSFLLEFDGAAKETLINTMAETWQIDFTSRLTGIDEGQQLINIDYYGDAAFINNGFELTKTGSNYIVQKGVAYIGGLRGELILDEELFNLKNTKVFADFSYQGNLVSKWVTKIQIVVANELNNYEDDAGINHYVSTIAEIDENGNIIDLRNKMPIDIELAEIKKQLDNKIDTSELAQKTGNSESLAMSQKAVSEAISESYVNIPDATDEVKGKVLLANELGKSESLVMNQKSTSALGFGVVGSFEDGLTFIDEITSHYQLVYSKTEDAFFRWDGGLPKPVPANSTPELTGGKGDGKWKSVTEASLKQFAENSQKNRNPIPQRHDFAFVAAKFIREKTELCINSSSLLQSIDLTVPVSPEHDLIFKIQVTGLESSYNFSAGTAEEKEAFVVAGICDGLMRENWNMRSHTAKYDGNILTITLPKAALLTEFASAGVRLGVNASESFEIKKFSAFQNGKRIAFIPFNRIPPKKLWGGASVLRAQSTGLGFDFGINMQLGKESLFIGNDFLTSSPNGSIDNIASQEWGLELNRRWTVQFPQFYKWYFEPGTHSTYRRVTTLSLLKESYLLGDNAQIIGGVELPTASWISEGEYNGIKVFSSLYDYDSNPDTAIRNGSKQPFLAVLVPDSKSNSVVSYALKNVSSIDAVKNTEYAYYYDHATKKAYFNWGKDNDNAYLYVCEVDNIINATSTVYAAGCTFLASKSDTVKIQPDSYSRSRFAGLYQCVAGVSAGGSGAYAINNIDSECIMSGAKSHKNDGFNYHYAGTSLIKDCVTSHNGDDGISHHEGCEGYVVGADILYNYAAASVPAFGAKVWHFNCNAEPALQLSSKPYAGKYACISGQGQSTEAWYDNCFLRQRASIGAYYSCHSQQEGTQAILYINAAKIDNEKIKLYETSNESSLIKISKTNDF